MIRGLFIALALSACGGSASDADLGVDAALAADLAVEAGDLGPGAECTYNRDCVAAARCGCDVTKGCFCELGARGTGVNGVDTCTDGNGCQSSLCVEGPGGVSYCSDECTGAEMCTGALPRCIAVALLGKICARNP